MTIDEAIEELKDISKAGFGFSNLVMAEMPTKQFVIKIPGDIQFVANGNGSEFYILSTKK